MPHQENCLIFTTRWTVFRALVVLLLTLHPCTGKPAQVVAAVGEDIILPCYLQPDMDASNMTVEWLRPDLSPPFIHAWEHNKERLYNKHPSYEGRTSLSIEGMRHGNISLKLSRVKLSDKGTYTCVFPKLLHESLVQLIVVAVSSPVIDEINSKDTIIQFHCESRGWYPEPEVLWLDGEGKILSAGPTETVRGPDDLYTVSSRLTVEKRHSTFIDKVLSKDFRVFTCRIQQKNIGQTRETHITVQDYINTAIYIAELIGVIVIVCLTGAFLMTMLCVLFLYKWCHRRNQTVVADTEQQQNKDSKQEQEETTFINEPEPEVKKQSRKLRNAGRFKRETISAMIHEMIFTRGRQRGENNTDRHNEKNKNTNDVIET